MPIAILFSAILIAYAINQDIVEDFLSIKFVLVILIIILSLVYDFIVKDE
jgi:hypothetical protein